MRCINLEINNGIKLLFVAIASIAAIALGAGCHGKHSKYLQSSSIENSSTLRRGLGGEPGSLDPGTAADSFASEVLDDLYEGLTSEASDGAVLPGVAASWAVDRTGTKYRFQLRC